MRIFCLTFLGAALVCGQTPTEVLSFGHAAGPQQFQEIANAVRIIAAVQNCTVDAEAKTLTVGGTPDQLALADWVFHEFDVDPQASRPAMQEYVVPHASDDVVRVWYFHGLPPQQLQEIVNMMRTITDVALIYQDRTVNAIAARGTSAQAAASGWLAGTVTQMPSPGTHEYDLPPSADYMGRAGTVVRVFFLTQNETQQQLQEVVNALRTVTDISKIYQYLPTHAITLRGHAEQSALADWLIDKLDRPAAAQNAAAEYTFTGPSVLPPGSTAVRVFYVPAANTPQALQEMVTSVRRVAQIPKVYACLAPRAIALRGTAAQVTQAEGLLQ
ncbi:MAG TPA: hypothetical protein VKB88_18220 [Bryobacteraceae bacterium]|nr:hypothetical protein [Bryobacteraceae bacterium]